MTARRRVQLDFFRRTPSEAELAEQHRDGAMASFERRFGNWLHYARMQMVMVIGQKGSCTSDDCWNLCPPPPEAHPSIMGALFKHPSFRRVGATQSRRESAHRRWISVYELEEP